MNGHAGENSNSRVGENTNSHVGDNSNMKKPPVETGGG